MIKDKRKLSILVIEDNSGDFLLVEEFLEEQIDKPEIIHATTYKQAIQLLALHKNNVDIILLDLSLPDLTGDQLIDKIIKACYSCPIIILTGYADIDFSTQSISKGIMDYLIKDDLSASGLYKSIIYSIERKKSTSQLKESEKRYSDLFYMSPQPIFVFEPGTFKFIQVNEAAIKLYGYSEAEFLSMTLIDVTQKEDVHSESSPTDSHPGDGAFKHLQLHHTKSGNILEVEIYSTPIKVNNKELISVVAIDVTEKNLYEQKLMKSIIKTQEDERYEIGGELHDNVAQLLATSKLTLSMLKPVLPVASMPMYNQCSEYIMMAAEEIRNLSHRLAPAFFDDSTFEEAFTRLFKAFNIEGTYTISMKVDASVAAYPLSLEIQLNLYRIVQEQLRNILKYAKATTIQFDIAIINNKLAMNVVDNGAGFNTNTAKSGIGIANMRRRTELFKGKFEIDSSPGNGCAIHVNIPLEEIDQL